MIVLDTTVLVYAVGTAHPLRAPCRSLVAAIGEGAVAATTTAEVIQEFAHVRARRQGRADAAALARSYAALLFPLVTIDDDDLAAGLDLFASHDSLGAFDCVLAAAAIRLSAWALVSADRGFATIDGLRHIDPAIPDVVTALAHLKP